MPTRQELEAQYRAAEARQHRLAVFKRVALWFGITLGLFGMVYGLAQLGSEQSKPRTGTIADPIDTSDWSKGGTLATNTLIEYGDFQCPGCASAAPFIQRIEKTYGTQLRIVFRHFPLRSIHPYAQLASQAAEAAGKQGKFWEMHDLLYAKQSTWVNATNPQSVFESYAVQLNVNLDQFRTDLQSSVVKDKIDRDIATGNRASVQATPSFFLNGQYMNFDSYEQLEQLIKQTLGQ